MMLHHPLFFCRAENETRTRDPHLGKVMLYQLSYFRKNFVFAAFRHDSAKQINLILLSLLRKVRFRNDGAKIQLFLIPSTFF